MSSRYRKSKKADNQIKYIKSSDSNKKEPFARIYPSLLYNPKFLELTSSAQVIYIHMLVKCCSSDDRITCTFPRSEVTRCGFSTHTFDDARNALLKHGFIQQQRFVTNGRTVVYRLSDNWYKYSGDVPEDARYF